MSNIFKLEKQPFVFRSYFFVSIFDFFFVGFKVFSFIIMYLNALSFDMKFKKAAAYFSNNQELKHPSNRSRN